MKRLTVLLSLCLCCASVALAQDDPEFESCSLEQIYRDWAKVPIKNVLNSSLGIMLERFDQTWPTYSVEEARGTMEKGLSEEVLEEETDRRVVNDSKNGYVEVGDDGTDSQYMSACVWRRSNGHSLFAVHLGKPTDPEIDFVCFYDYNPQTKTLTPEPQILAGFKRKAAKSQISHQLPQKGKTLRILEYKYSSIYVHEYEWDGMKPVFKRIVEEAQPEDTEADELFVRYKGAKPSISDFVTTILSQEKKGEALDAMQTDWKKHLRGQMLTQGTTILVDAPNGYVRYDHKYSTRESLYIECCYWNCSDGMHKLVAENVVTIYDGKPIEGQYSGVAFYIYDNNRRAMQAVYAPNLGINEEPPSGTSVTRCKLPQTGKALVYEYYIPSGKITKRFTWNGAKFVAE